jgi:hypothetical protein
MQEKADREERERERERNAWSLTGFLSLFLLEEKAKEKLSKRKAKLIWGSE